VIQCVYRDAEIECGQLTSSSDREKESNLVKLAVIVNPAAARGGAGREWHRLQAAIEQSLGAHEVHFSESRLHATELTRNALCAGATTVLSVGGDGTHSEVVNGFFDAGRAVNPRACLGLIPIGTGSDLVRTLGVPRVPLHAVESLRDAVPRQYDLILCTCTDTEGEKVERYVLNGVDCGFGAIVADRVNRSSKMIGGFVPYLVASLTTLIRWRHVDVCMALNEIHSVSASVMDVAVTNGRFTGGGMHIAPRASMNDGFLDVVITDNVGKLRALSLLPSLYRNRILERKGVTWRQCRRIILDSDQDVPVAVDGELIGKLPATFDVMPAAIRMLIPSRPVG